MEVSAYSRAMGVCSLALFMAFQARRMSSSIWRRALLRMSMAWLTLYASDCRRALSLPPLNRL
ncbi:hypothetical protein D3C81_1894910 [compost metagenome]